MKKLVLAVMLAFGTSVVSAQTGSTGLGPCLADSTSGKDRKDLVRWTAVAMAAHPALADVIKVPAGKSEEVNRIVAQIFMRLITVDCRAEYKAAYKSGGEGAIEDAFGALGTTAADEVMNNPLVTKAFNEMLKYIDFKKMNELLTSSL